MIEEPWALPPGCERVPFRRATDGEKPRLPTSIALFADDECLTALFLARDDGVVATHFERDAPLYEEDVVELFLAPREPTRYFEFEVSPLGTIFDARIESPNGTRDGMRADIVVFDADNVRTPATKHNPKQFPIGIDYVIVNGTVLAEGGKLTDALPGQIIRGPLYQG